MKAAAALKSFAQWMAFIVPFAVYAVTAQPDVGLWDTGEMATVPYIFGVAHPTGFPLYILAGWLFTHLFVIGNVAWRMAIFSALTAAGATALLYRLARNWMPAPYALLAPISFAFGEIAWTRAIRPEVHIFALFWCALSIVLADEFRRGRRRAGFFLPLSCAAAIAVHPVAIWILPGCAVLVSQGLAALAPATRRQTVQHIIAGMGLGILFGSAIYATIAWRSVVATVDKLDPTLTLGFGPGMPFWDYGHPSTLAQFIWFVRGTQFAPGRALLGVFAIFSYPSYVALVLPSFVREFSVGFLLLALIGAVALCKDSRRTGLAFCLLTLAGIPFAAQYRIEIDSDRYLLVSFWTLSFLLALGTYRCLRFARSPNVTRGFRQTVSGVTLALALLGIVGTLADSMPVIAHQNSHEGRDVITRIIAQTPANAVIISSWVYATPLAYAAYVEHSFGSRIIVPAELDALRPRLSALRRQRPVYLIDDKVPEFDANSSLFRVRDGNFPRLIEVNALKARGGASGRESVGYSAQ